jgi:hypothetical protein
MTLQAYRLSTSLKNEKFSGDGIAFRHIKMKIGALWTAVIFPSIIC